MDGAEDQHQSFLDPHILRRLFERLDGTDVDEFEIVSGSSRLYVRREPGRRAVKARRDISGATLAAQGVPVTAPLTGVYYARPAPEQPPYVSPGATIEHGQIVALIETMKLFNEVTAEISGEVLSVVVQQGDLVEAGQPLIYVLPHNGGDEA